MVFKTKKEAISSAKQEAQDKRVRLVVYKFFEGHEETEGAPYSYTTCHAWEIGLFIRDAEFICEIRREDEVSYADPRVLWLERRALSHSHQ